ncbi:hypothetical protein BDN72DRAFT_956818 [Pluteus cervinus]|uniref:Uncharacterized protein n=1 Tax=Pluteus cervinus TaxID=181527 RepID=A0ACD3B4M3_9AGAR|nr:hypothetical protein BDN72DRAFT_956818 [Pluteus cervinus]
MTGPPSPEALYHAISQAPDSANISQTNLAAEEVEDEQLDLPTDPPALIVDHSVKLIHFILGCSVLLPWNVMITATPFFLSRVTGSPFQAAFGSYLSTSFTLSNFTFLAHATATAKQVSPSRQTRWTILLIAVLTLLLTLSTYVVVHPSLFFTFVILNGAIQAAAGSYLQTSVIAVASLFGPQAVQAMMFGQGAVAVAVSGVQVLSAAGSVWGVPADSISTWVTDGKAEERSAFIFFGLSTVYLVMSAVAHHSLTKLPAYKTIAAPLEQHNVKGDSLADVDANADERRVLVSAGRKDSESWDEQKARLFRVARGNVIYEIAVSCVFMVTLSVFPPITTSIRPVNPGFHPLLFSAVHFLVFNIGDFLGRYLCAFPSLLIWSGRRLLTLSLSRTLFIPLFLMCNIQRLDPVPAPIHPLSPVSSLVRAAITTTSISLPGPIINSDFLFMALLCLFGVSNGYVSSLCMMSVASIEHNPFLRNRQITAGAKKAREDVDVSATVASFCLVGGLVIGSAASFAVRAAVCDCNPFIA